MLVFVLVCHVLRVTVTVTVTLLHCYTVTLLLLRVITGTCYLSTCYFYVFRVPCSVLRTYYVLHITSEFRS